MTRIAHVHRLFLLTLLTAVAAGCVAVAAGAGAAAAIAWTERGARSQVQGSTSQVFDRSVTVFNEMGIARSGESTDEGGRKRMLKGTRGDLDVTVEITQETASTSQVEVYARRSAVEWDKDFARDVLTRIIRRS